MLRAGGRPRGGGTAHRRGGRPAPRHPRRPAAGGARLMERAALMVGLMSGTSLDGMDAALVRFTGPTRAELLAFASRPYDADGARRASRRGRRARGAPAALARLHVRIAEWAAEAVQLVLQAGGVRADEVDGIAFPGQTIWHEPPLVSWQLGEPAVLAERVRGAGGERIPRARRGGGRAGRAAGADGRPAALLQRHPESGAAQPGRHGQPDLRAEGRRGEGRHRLRHRAGRGRHRRRGAPGRSRAQLRPRREAGRRGAAQRSAARPSC